jgi:aryl-alcohol dehydrogenase-like predicted oxidoreductase
MEYVNLGKTGLKVSRICLGCMSYGDPAKWVHNWVLTENEGRPFIKAALEALGYGLCRFIPNPSLGL